MYTKIVNPKTGRRVNINSATGKQIIKNYIDFLQLGGVILRDKATSIIASYPNTRQLLPKEAKIVCAAIIEDKHNFCPKGLENNHRNRKIDFKNNTCRLNDSVRKAKENKTVVGKENAIREFEKLRDNYHTCYTARNRELTIRGGICVKGWTPDTKERHIPPKNSMNNFMRQCQTDIDTIEKGIPLIYLSEIYEDLNMLKENYDKLTPKTKTDLYNKLFPKRKDKKIIIYHDPYNTETIIANALDKDESIELLRNILINYTDVDNKKKEFEEALEDVEKTAHGIISDLENKKKIMKVITVSEKDEAMDITSFIEKYKFFEKVLEKSNDKMLMSGKLMEKIEVCKNIAKTKEAHYDLFLENRRKLFGTNLEDSVEFFNVLQRRLLA